MSETGLPDSSRPAGISGRAAAMHRQHRSSPERGRPGAGSGNGPGPRAGCRRFTSPLTRAVQTAQAIRSETIILDGLRELDYGAWEGLTFSQIRLRYPALYAARGDDPTLLPPGAESSCCALARFSAAMEEAARRSPGDFAVVAHGGVIALFLEHVTGRWNKPGYCEIKKLQWDNSGFIRQEDSS